MARKALLRHAADVLMTADLLALMAYMLTEQAVHEWLGLAALVLFILHHVLNGGWIRGLGRGRWTAPRVLQAAVVLLLLVSMLAQMASGIAMSRYALPFLSIPLPISTARLIHLSCAYWSFLLISLHIGLHWSVFLGMGRKKLRRGQPLPPLGVGLLRLLAVLLAGYGLLCFFRLGMPSYLFVQTEFAFFDYSKPPLLSMAELIAVMSLWILAGYLPQKLALSAAKKKRGR